MDEKVKALFDNLEAKIGEVADEKLKAFATKEMAEIKENVEAKEKALKELDTRISQMEVDAKKAEKMASESKTFKSFGAAVVDTLKSNQEKFNAAKERGGKVSFEVDAIKAVGAISSSASITGDIPQADRMAGVNLVATRTPRMLDFMTSSTTDRQKVEWVYETQGEGDAGQTAEGTAKNQFDIDYLVGSENIVKTTAFVKATTEMLDDWGELESLINNDLRKRILRKVEEGAFNGNGTAPNLRGITTVATAWAAQPYFSNVIDEANVADVIVNAITQIEVAEQNVDNLTVFVHPETINLLRAIKVSTTDRRYVDRLQFIGNQMTIDGIPVVKTTLLSNDELLVGDFSKAQLVQRQGLRFEIGEDGNDFTENKKTLLAEWRGAVVVKQNDRNCFIWASSINTAILALDPDLS